MRMVMPAMSSVVSILVVMIFMRVILTMVMAVIVSMHVSINTCFIMPVLMAMRQVFAVCMHMFVILLLRSVIGMHMVIMGQVIVPHGIFTTLLVPRIILLPFSSPLFTNERVTMYIMHCLFPS
jgi:hypothetical protein